MDDKLKTKMKFNAGYYLRTLHVELSDILAFEQDDKIPVYNPLHVQQRCIDKALAECKAQDLLPYYVTVSSEAFGVCVNVLYVSPYPEDWDVEQHLIRTGAAAAYVENLMFPECSELGEICICENNGHLFRM